MYQQQNHGNAPPAKGSAVDATNFVANVDRIGNHVPIPILCSQSVRTTTDRFSGIIPSPGRKPAIGKTRNGQCHPDVANRPGQDPKERTTWPIPKDAASQRRLQKILHNLDRHQHHHWLPWSHPG